MLFLSTTKRRRMGLLICLLFLHGIVLIPAASAKIITEYATRMLLSSSYERQKRDYDEWFGDTGVIIVASGGYELIYRETDRTEDSVEKKDNNTNGFEGLLFLQRNKMNWGVRSAFDFSRLKSEWKGEDYLFEASGRRISRQIVVGGWWKRESLSMDYSIGIDPGYMKDALSQHAPVSQEASDAWRSPGIDLATTIAFEKKRVKIAGYYENSSPFAGYCTVKNQSESARRNFSLIINDNRFGITNDYRDKVQHITVDASVTVSSKSEIHQASSDLPLSMEGNGVSFEVDGEFRQLPYHPEAQFTGDWRWLGLSGYDYNDSRFLMLDTVVASSITGMIAIHPGTKSVCSVLGSYMHTSVGDGMIAFYPFTNWLYILDMPDRVKIYEMDIRLMELGLSGSRHWNILKKGTLITGFTITGCKAIGEMETAELVRYMGIIPVYENREKSQIVDKIYIIMKPAFHYRHTLRSNELYITVEQIVPIELSTGSKKSDTSQPEDKETKHRLFGGLHIAAGVRVRL